MDHLGHQARDVTPTESEDPEPARAKEQLERIDAEQAEARTLRADDQLSPAEFTREISRLEHREAELREDMSLPSASPLRSGSAPARIIREWTSYTVDMKRAEIRRSIEAVVITKGGKGGAQRGAFRSELIEIVWK